MKEIKTIVINGVTLFLACRLKTDNTLLFLHDLHGKLFFGEGVFFMDDLKLALFQFTQYF